MTAVTGATGDVLWPTHLPVDPTDALVAQIALNFLKDLQHFKAEPDVSCLPYSFSLTGGVTSALHSHLSLDLPAPDRELNHHSLSITEKAWKIVKDYVEKVCARRALAEQISVFDLIFFDFFCRARHFPELEEELEFFAGFSVIFQLYDTLQDGVKRGMYTPTYALLSEQDYLKQKWEPVEDVLVEKIAKTERGRRELLDNFLEEIFLMGAMLRNDSLLQHCLKTNASHWTQEITYDRNEDASARGRELIDYCRFLQTAYKGAQKIGAPPVSPIFDNLAAHLKRFPWDKARVKSAQAMMNRASDGLVQAHNIQKAMYEMLPASPDRDKAYFAAMHSLLVSTALNECHAILESSFAYNNTYITLDQLEIRLKKALKLLLNLAQDKSIACLSEGVSEELPSPFSTANQAVLEKIFATVHRDILKIINKITQKEKLKALENWLERSDLLTLPSISGHGMVSTNFLGKTNWSALERSMHALLTPKIASHLDVLKKFFTSLPQEELRVNHREYLAYVQERMFRESLPLAILYILCKDAMAMLNFESDQALLTSSAHLDPPEQVVQYAYIAEVEEHCEVLLARATPAAPVAAAAAVAVPSAAPKVEVKAAPKAAAAIAAPKTAPKPAPAKRPSPAAAAAAAVTPPAKTATVADAGPLRGENRLQYAQRLVTMGWKLTSSSSGTSHHTMTSPDGDVHFTVPLGGKRDDKKAIAPKTRVRGAPR